MTVYRSVVPVDNASRYDSSDSWYFVLHFSALVRFHWCVCAVDRFSGKELTMVSATVTGDYTVTIAKSSSQAGNMMIVSAAGAFIFILQQFSSVSLLGLTFSDTSGIAILNKRLPVTSTSARIT